MYQYSPSEKQFLHQRADQFQDQVNRFNDKSLNPDEFQQLRLRNGLYVERHAPMLRVAVPYGVLSSIQLRKLAYISRTYDKGYGHFTTRQNIQFNWPEIDDVPALLHDLAEVGMHGIQTSGSCIRNITSDPLAGVATDEIEDPRPWCELLRQWSTLHPEFNWLPRKFKFAITGATKDRAAIKFHDIGIQIYKNEKSNLRFRIYVGGGMGRTPVIGKVLEENVKPGELLGLIESALRVYNKYGRRDNKYKSRIKILVNDLGIEAFRKQVSHLNETFNTSDNILIADKISNLRTHFQDPKNLAEEHISAQSEHRSDTPIPVDNPAFRNWRKHNVESHKNPAYSIVHISLKAPTVAPGDLSAGEMEGVALISDQFSNGEIRTTHEQNLVLPSVLSSDLYAVWHRLNAINLATPNIGKLTDLIACPGLDFCSLANASTIPLAKELNERINSLDQLYDIGEIKLKMSGCMNACGHHHAGHIGILGVDKKGKEWYQITLGGSATLDARIGQRLGPAVPRDQLIDAIENLINTYLIARIDHETFFDTVVRTGIEPFRDNLYNPFNRNSDTENSLAA